MRWWMWAAAMVACGCQAEEVDEDGDGYDVEHDCNDQDASIHPDHFDMFNDGVDADCDDEDGVISDDYIWPAFTQSSAGIYAVLACDINGDGTEDLLVQTLDDEPAAMMNLLIGPLQPGALALLAASQNDKYPTGWFPWAWTCGDVNGDGFDDVIEITGARTGREKGLGVRYGSTDGLSALDPQITWTTDDTLTDTLHSGDLDGDGADEIVMCNDLASSLRELGESNVLDYSALQLVGSPSEVGRGMGPCTMAQILEDVDGDGDGELLISRNSASPSLLAASNPQVPEDLDNAWAALNQTLSANAMVGDYDGDGQSDLAMIALTWGGTSQTFLSLTSDPAATWGDGFSAASAETSGRVDFESTVGVVFTIEDFDGDGGDDLVLLQLDGDANETDLMILSGNASLSHDGGPKKVKLFHNRLPASFANLAVGDLDGDGTSDLAIVTEYEGTFWLRVLFTGDIGSN